ncbi:MAG: formylglycine-generating enzyme family protein [Dokdonella sp.]
MGRHTSRNALRAPRTNTLLATLVVVALCSSAVLAAAPDYVQIPATTFSSVLATEAATTPVTVPAYAMRAEPVTNAQYLAFVTTHTDWRRDRVPVVFAEKRYLSQWSAPDTLGANALPDQPVTQVSWFAAQAFCASEQARLPTWIEWERAASASATVADARGDPAWRQHLLDWYARPSSSAMPVVGGAPNLFGVRDLHALVWEWTDDFSALMVTSDSRDQGDPDRLKFCGEGALSLRDRNNYALLMRIAMLSSLKATDTTANLGFRCVREKGIKP